MRHLATALLLATAPAWALDKQGCAHGRSTEGAASGFNLSAR